MTQSTSTVSEYTFESYQDRQWDYISGERIKHSLDQMRYGDRFRFENGIWTPEPYPGFAIVSMVNDNPGNDSLMLGLQYYRNRLIQEITDESICYFLPIGSFHQTIANTLSSDRYRKYLVETGIIDTYPQLIEEVFSQAPGTALDQPVRMRMIGFSVFGSSMGLLGVFEEESEYDAIQQLRDFLYTHPRLNEIDIRRTRPFIGHITYAYFGPGALSSKEKLFDSLTSLNEEISRDNLVFHISKAQLRYYHNLSSFHTQPGYPSYNFYPGTYGI